jgi:hypothetical protein
MSMKRFKRAFAIWCYGLVGGCIGGGVASLLSWGGLAGAHASGIDVPTLNFKGMGIIFLSGVISHGAAWVMKSPLPPLQFDDSTPPFPNEDGSNVNPNSKTP